MATEGPNYPGTAISASAHAPEDDDAWVNPTNVGANDGNDASITAATFDSPDISRQLYASQFGFAIPAGSTIDGILVEIERNNAAGAASDNRVQLTTAENVFVGDNKADTALDWPTSMTIASYGGSADTWNASPTPAMVNDAGFGVTLSAQANAANTDIAVDFIRVTITYTPPAGAATELITSYDFQKQLEAHEFPELYDPTAEKALATALDAVPPVLSPNQSMTERFEGQPPGTDADTTNTAWSAMFGTAVRKFDNDLLVQTASCRFLRSSGEVGHFAFIDGFRNHNRFFYSFLYAFSSRATGSFWIFRKNSNTPKVGVNPSGQLTIFDGVNTAVATSATVLPLSTWFRLEITFDQRHNVQDSAYVKAVIYLDPVSLTPTETIEAFADWDGTGNTTDVAGLDIGLVGAFGVQSNPMAAWVDDVQVSTESMPAPFQTAPESGAQPSLISQSFDPSPQVQAHVWPEEYDPTAEDSAQQTSVSMDVSFLFEVPPEAGADIEILVAADINHQSVEIESLYPRGPPWDDDYSTVTGDVAVVFADRLVDEADTLAVALTETETVDRFETIEGLVAAGYSTFQGSVEAQDIETWDEYQSTSAFDIAIVFADRQVSDSDTLAVSLTGSFGDQYGSPDAETASIFKLEELIATTYAPPFQSPVEEEPTWDEYLSVTNFDVSWFFSTPEVPETIEVLTAANYSTFVGSVEAQDSETWDDYQNSASLEITWLFAPEVAEPIETLVAADYNFLGSVEALFPEELSVENDAGPDIAFLFAESTVNVVESDTLAASLNETESVLKPPEPRPEMVVRRVFDPILPTRLGPAKPYPPWRRRRRPG